MRTTPLSVSLAALALSMLWAAPVAHAETTRQSWHTYDAAVGGPVVGASVPTEQHTYRVGGVGFAVHDVDAEVLVAVLDDTGRRTAARYMFTDAAGEEVASGDMCWKRTLDVPANAVGLWVFPSQLIHPCHVSTMVGPATTGTVYASFRS